MRDRSVIKAAAFSVLTTKLRDGVRARTRNVLRAENYEGRGFNKQTNGNRSVLFAFRDSVASSRGASLSFLYIEAWNDMISYPWYEYKRNKTSSLSTSNAKLTSY